MRDTHPDQSSGPEPRRTRHAAYVPDRRPLHRAVSAACLLLPGAAVAQGPAALSEPAALEQAYRSTAPFSGLEFSREDLPGVVFFVERSERPDLRYLLSIRAHLARSVRAFLEKTIFTPAGITTAQRPLVVWLLKTPESYEKLGGPGMPFPAFDPAHKHTLNYPGQVGQEREEQYEFVAGCILQVLDLARTPAGPVELSAWLRSGIAHHYATLPTGVLLLDQEPGFGRVYLELVTSHEHYAGQPPIAAALPKLPREHHPVAVVGYPRLESYLEACGVAGNQRIQQRQWFASYSTLLVSFLDRACKGAWRADLAELLRAEAAGKHGFESFDVVFAAGPERDELCFRLQEYCRSPKLVLEAARPKWDEQKTPILPPPGTASAPSSRPSEAATPRYFRDSAAVLPEEPEPELLILARALRAAANHDFATAGKLVEALPGANADTIRAAVAAGRALQEKLAAEVQGGRKPTLFLVDPEKPKESALFQVLSFQMGAKELEVERKPRRLTIPVSTVAPHLLGESLERQKVPLDGHAKAALGLVTAAWACGRADEKAILARARARGFVSQSPLLPELAGQLLLLASFDRALVAASDPAIGPGKALAALEAGLRTSPAQRACARALLRARWPELWRTRAFLSEMLGGEVTLAKEGQVRIDYPFDRESELADWLPVDGRAEGFVLPSYPGGKGTPKLSDGLLEMHSSIVLRHRLQFAGDVEIELRAGIYTKDTDAGNVPVIAPHPAAGIFARPGGSTILMRPNGVLETAREGVGAQNETVVNEHWRDASTEIMDRKGLRLVATRDAIRVCGKSKDYLSIPMPPSMERKGAVVLASSDMTELWRAVLDRITIIGTPDPESFDALGSHWVEKVLKRW